MSVSSHGIVLLLDKNSNDLAIQMSRLTVRFAAKADFVLDMERARPHITLFQVMLSEQNLPRAIAAVEKAVVDGLKGAKLSGAFNTMKPYSDWLYLTAEPAEVNKTPTLMALHHAVVEATAPLRSGGFPARRGLHPKAVETWRKYGNHRVGYNYHPHVTIREIRPDAKLYDVAPFTVPWEAKQVAIAKMTDGVITKIEHVIDI